MTPQQIATIPDGWRFSRIGDEARAALAEIQARALNVAEVGLENLSEAQVNVLTTAQVRSLNYRAFRYLGPGQSPKLTAVQIHCIPDGWWFSRMSEPARAALSERQIQNLNVAEIGLEDLTREQILGLDIDQIQAVDYSDFRYLAAVQIPDLTAAQIREIPNNWWFTRMSDDACEALTPEQVAQLNTAEVSIENLTYDQRGHLTVAQIQTVPYHDFDYLAPDQAVHLMSAQLAAIPSKWHFTRMSDEAQTALDRNQLLSLQPAVFAALAGLPDSFVPDPEMVGTSTIEAMQAGDDGLANDPRTLAERAALFALVPHEAATHVTIASGAWSNPLVWANGAIPSPRADVLVSEDTVVEFDVIQTDPIHTLRIDGVLTFDTDQDTQLFADTIVVHTFGKLHVGTENDPIAEGVAARIAIADTGPIDMHWDPNLISRGLISRGEVRMVGQEVTSFSALAVDPSEGDTQLVLTEVPVNWKVGDRLVLTGTVASTDNPQDEELEILAIQGNAVTVDPLQYDHHTPAGHGLQVYVANMNRNVVVFSENPDDTDRQGHVMFMHNSNVEVHDVGLYGLGRSDKRNPANDPILDENGNLREDTGLNRRGRYSLHFHREGTDPTMRPANVSGSAVVDSPGWGFVNHGSFVHFDNKVAFHVVGASFVTEDGNEIGSFRNNLSIRTTGSGHGLEDRRDIHDFGHNGHGFWLQGPGTEVIDNIAVGNRDGAFVFFTASAKAMFDAANVLDPNLAAGRDQVPVGSVPLRTVSVNIAFASDTGLETWFHMTNMTDGQAVIDDFTSWNTRGAGMHTPYTGQTTLRDVTLIGRPGRPRGEAINGNDVTNNMTYERVQLDGWSVGIEVPVRRSTEIIDGLFSTIRAIEISSARDTIRTVDIVGATLFQTLSDAQLRDHEQFDIFMRGEIDVENRDLETFFSPDIVRLGTVRYNGLQVYYHKQASGFVAFPGDSAPDFIPPELLDLTNAQLWAQFGIAPAGTVAPADAVQVDRINGLVGSPTEYLPEVELVSPQYINQLADYQLEYENEHGYRFIDPQSQDLREGWNLLTRMIDGQRRTFFVFGDIEAPTFEVDDPESLVVNPEGLEFGFVLHGTIHDDSFGSKGVRIRFDDLTEPEILTRADGSEYISLEFEIRDRAGNATLVSLELNLDPDAPIVPGTGQEDLPPRDLPETLRDLIEFYFL